MDLSQAITLAGASILVGILVEVLKRSLAWGQAQVDRFGALVAIVIGVLVVEVLTAAQGLIDPANPWPILASAAITGVLAGAAASGLYDGGTLAAAKVVGLRQPAQDAPGDPTAPGADTTSTTGTGDQ